MRLLLTGAEGFTGTHLRQAAAQAGFEVCALTGDLQDSAAVLSQVLAYQPTHVVHLAGISHVTLDSPLQYYQVNLLASLGLLDALAALPQPPQKVILASSANVYGNRAISPISEAQPPSPISHYAMSKLALEYLSRPYYDRLPIVITRPFNYTGVGHDLKFVIPKIVDHFRRRADTIELGNIDVLREYNDVRDVCAIYLALLLEGQPAQTYNIASGRTYSLRQIVAYLEKLTGHQLVITANPALMRANEIAHLGGDATRLQADIGQLSWRQIEATLEWMLAAG